MEILLARATICDKETGGSWGGGVEGFFYQKDIQQKEHLKLTEGKEIPKDCYWSWNFTNVSDLKPNKP